MDGIMSGVQVQPFKSCPEQAVVGLQTMAPGSSNPRPQPCGTFTSGSGDSVMEGPAKKFTYMSFRIQS